MTMSTKNDSSDFFHTVVHSKNENWRDANLIIAIPNPLSGDSERSIPTQKQYFDYIFQWCFVFTGVKLN